MKGPITLGTIRTTFVLGLRLFVQAGTLLIVARMLGPKEFGAFAGIVALAVVLGSLSTFGTHLVLLAEVSKEPKRREMVLPYAVPWTLICGTSLLVIYLAACLTILQRTNTPVHVLILLGVTETILQPMIVLLSTERLAMGAVARSQLLQTIAPSLRLAAAGIIISSNIESPFEMYVIAYITASIIALQIALATQSAKLPCLTRWRFPKSTELREALSYAIINITKASPSELDKTLASKLLPLHEAGVYAAGARVIGASTLPVIAMTLSSMPRLFRDGMNNPNRTGRLLSWMFGTAGLYGIGLAFILWLASPLFDWAFGATYRGISIMVAWLSIAIPGMVLRLTAGNVLMALGKPWMRVGFETVGLLVITMATAGMTKSLGLIGMPLALACSEWAMALTGGAMIIKTYRHRIIKTQFTSNNARNDPKVVE